MARSFNQVVPLAQHTCVADVLCGIDGRGDPAFGRERGHVTSVPRVSAAFADTVDTALATLAEELTPRLAAVNARRLLDVLRAAQRTSPRDTQLFVTQINRLFDLYRLRVDTGDGRLYRLKYLPGGGSRGHIYLLDGHGVNWPTFASSQLRLVDASSRYCGNKFNPDSAPPLPVLAPTD